MTTPTMIGIAASALTGASMLPQLVKLLKEKKAKDISLLMLIVLFAGLVGWVIYGVLKKDWIIIASNGFSLVVNIMMIFFAVKYKTPAKGSRV